MDGKAFKGRLTSYFTAIVKSAIANVMKHKI